MPSSDADELRRRAQQAEEEALRAMEAAELANAAARAAIAAQEAQAAAEAARRAYEQSQQAALEQQAVQILEADQRAAAQAQAQAQAQQQPAPAEDPAVPTLSADTFFAHTDAPAGADPSAQAAATQQPLIRKRKRRHRKAKHRLKVLLLILAILAVIAGLVYYFAQTLVQQGQASLQQAAVRVGENYTDELVIETEPEVQAVSYDEGRTVTYNGTRYRLNENMVSIVVIGCDVTESAEEKGRAGQADSVMVLALDTATGKITFIGVPRDSMVEVGTFVGEAFLGMDQMQLTLAFSYGDGGATSSEYVTRAVSRLMYNIPMTYYMTFNMAGVTALNDAIGGVALTPLATIPNTNIVEGEPTVLLGDNALKYVRFRDTASLTSSLDRQARQTQYIQLFAQQALQSALAAGGVSVLTDLYSTAASYSVTNLGLSEFSYLASTVVANGVTSVNVTTLQGTMQQGEQYAEYILDKSNVYQTVLDVYYTPVS